MSSGDQRAPLLRSPVWVNWQAPLPSTPQIQSWLFALCVSLLTLLRL
jgi:hypothetical protein